MKKENAIGRVPEILWYQIFKYFEIKDFIMMRAVCKKLKKNSDTYTGIYEQECLRIFTSGLELFR